MQAHKKIKFKIMRKQCQCRLPYVHKGTVTCTRCGEHQTMLPPDVTIKDIKEIRNYFGEHDVTLFEHRAFSILSRLINHLEASCGNIV